ncbi:Spore protein YkvP [Arthrobacter sp. SO5]|uniref:glycosyltransferase family protein n=1 Tax=Arthrobacter sp. SO5 TaxID=1897055 RepID=UPI001E450331|nr:glycosyltransferase [Arthrobacter sp. SO5]MCB5274640.1 Spore protein YkvP [Arthrobacter sp. SO5]
MGILGDARKALWHLRSGGPTQLQDWRLRQKAERGIFVPQNIKGAEGGWRGRGRKRQLEFTPYEFSAVGQRRDDLTVGVILDDFSRMAFSYEWNLLELRRDSWKDQLDRSGIDFLFVESAWTGNSGSWQYQLTGASGLGTEFVQLLEWCREHSIKTVFWNKEDPPHYDDFLAAAKLFDFVFTSDSDRIPDYLRDLGHDRVSALPFAAQPAIHNPVRPGHGWHSRGVAFAGMYFAHKYPERRAQMDMLLGAALAQAKSGDADLEIFSRQLGGDANYQFPQPFAKNVVGSLTYSQMLTAYRSYKVFLNVNSVVHSPSMCARRIFEITASGTPVVSTPSAAISRFFEGDEVLVASSKPEAGNLLQMLTSSTEFNERVVHKAQRRIWGEHTYAHRAESILQAVAPERSRHVALPSVSALVSTIRPHQLDHVFQTAGSQKGVDLELVLLTHGFSVDEYRLLDLARTHGVKKYMVLKAPGSLTLGECLNRCVKASTGAVLTKMDDDDFYAPNYLADLLNALSYSGADVVGKQSHYMHFLSSRATVLRAAHKEHRFSRLVVGPTITARRGVFEAHPFEALSRGEDTAFLTSVAAANGSIYSADRFNYCQMRSGAGHTWAATDDELAASGKIQIFGNPREHITL